MNGLASESAIFVFPRMGKSLTSPTHSTSRLTSVNREFAGVFYGDDRLVYFSLAEIKLIYHQYAAIQELGLPKLHWADI